MEQVFLAVQAQLVAKVTELKWIDLDFQQLDSFELRPPVLFPCALIDVELPECHDEGERRQICRCIVTVRVAMEQLGQTHAKTPTLVKTQAMAVYALLNKIRATLHGFQGDGFNRLLLRSITAERRQDPLKVFNLRFESSMVVDIPQNWIQKKLDPVVVYVKE